MPRSAFRGFAATLLAFTLSATPSASAQQGPPPLVPESVTPSPLVVEAATAAWMTEVERAAWRLQHGLWSIEDLDRVDAGRAQVASTIGRWDLVVDDEEASPQLRAEAMLRLGRAGDAVSLLEGVAEDAPILAVRAQALEALGRLDEAVATADRAIEVADEQDMEDGLAAVVAMRTRLAAGGGEPRDFETMLERLATLRDRIDRLDPRPRVIEGLLLVERGNLEEGVPALHEALARDPRRAEVWATLGRLATRRFDFDGGDRAAVTLDRLARVLGDDAPSIDAAVIRARGALMRNDPDLAAELLDEVLAFSETHPEALALRAATAAVQYDREDETDWMARLEAVEPNGARGWHEVGSALSFDRQYEVAADAFATAIERRPRWAEPQVDLGMLEMQSARDDRAREALETATELDPYHKGAAFSLFLLEELDGFETTESEHFILKYRPGTDEVVASGMLGPLEETHADLAARFRHEPDRKTVVELMPDHQFFAVRITGMPRIHTIAACTGPLIAIEVPRTGMGRKHLGLFDWLRVLRHEYAHTITLSQTRNRIPHWLTEAAATSIEQVPRTYEHCGELAARWRKGDLFDLDGINIAFVRPKRPSDRSMAYQQGAWMVEFMNERWGEQALVDLMALYFEGIQEKDAIPEALGISRDDFLVEFLDWAGEQIASWGLDPQPSLDELADEIRQADPDQAERLAQARRDRLARIAAGLVGEVGAPRIDDDSATDGPSTASRWPDLDRPPVEIDDTSLAVLLERHPDHPDLLELSIRRRLRDDPAMTPEIEDLLQRYATARPVDPYPHRVLARHLLDGPTPERAIPHLVELDLRSVKDPSFALEIARQARRIGDREQAFLAAERSARMNAYDPATRELAAACSIEAGRLDDAHRHVEALVVLEPHEPRHAARLAAVERLRSTGG